MLIDEASKPSLINWGDQYMTANHYRNESQKREERQQFNVRTQAKILLRASI
jgi:hypothetical protein